MKAALDGARQILMEEFAENAELLAELRSTCGTTRCCIHLQLIEGKAEEGPSFATTSTTGKRSTGSFPSRPGVVPGPQ